MYIKRTYKHKQLLEQGFYFSIGGDITLSRQAARNGASSEECFVWNSYLLKELEA